MRWSIRLARVAGVDVKIHVTFLLFLLWIGFTYYLQGGTDAAVVGLGFILLLFGCVVLHEFGHVLAARRYGISTEDITLLPIGGVARIARMPKDPKQELVIAAAGPAVNLVIALLLFMAIGRSNPADVLSLQNAQVGLLPKLLSVNIWLVLFNLIPAYPMDGGRILRSLLAMRLPYPRATQIAANIGQGIAFVFGFLGLFFNPMLIFIALFVYLGAAQEAAIAQMRDITERLPVSAAMRTDFRVLPLDASLRDAVKLLLATSQHEFPVADRAGGLAGVLTRDDLITALERSGPDSPIAPVIRTAVPELSARTPFERAVELMQETRSPVIQVTGDDGRLVGFVTAEDLGELVLVHSALGKARRPTGWLQPKVPSPRPSA